MIRRRLDCLMIRRRLDGLPTREGCSAAERRDCECSRDSSSRIHSRNVLPGSDCLAGEVAESGERHIVCAIPSFGHRSKTFSFAFTLEAEPSTFQLRNSGEVSRKWCPPIGSGSPRRLRSTSSPAIRHSSAFHFPALRELRIRLPHFPAPTQIILENSDSHARLWGRISCQNRMHVRTSIAGCRTSDICRSSIAPIGPLSPSFQCSKLPTLSLRSIACRSST
jgi:hypothetical protein